MLMGVVFYFSWPNSKAPNLWNRISIYSKVIRCRRKPQIHCHLKNFNYAIPFIHPHSEYNEIPFGYCIQSVSLSLSYFALHFHNRLFKDSCRCGNFILQIKLHVIKLFRFHFQCVLFSLLLLFFSLAHSCLVHVLEQRKKKIMFLFLWQKANEFVSIPFLSEITWMITQN